MSRKFVARAMRVIQALAAVGIALSAPALSAQAPDDKPPLAFRSAIAGREGDLAAAVFRDGAPVPVRCVLTNTSDDAILVLRPKMIPCSLNWSFGPEDGAEKVRRDGRWAESDAFVTQAHAVELAPGESVEVILDLTLYYAFPRTGRWTTTVVYRGWEWHDPLRTDVGVWQGYLEAPPLDLGIRFPDGPPEAGWATIGNSIALVYAKHLQRRARWDPALSVYRDIIDRGAGGLDRQHAKYYIARCLEQARRYAEASEAYEAFLERFPRGDCAFLARHHLALLRAQGRVPPAGQ